MPGFPTMNAEAITDVIEFLDKSGQSRIPPSRGSFIPFQSRATAGGAARHLRGGHQRRRPHGYRLAFRMVGAAGEGARTDRGVNGDGLNDVVTSLEAHGWGFAWYEQKRDKSGDITFTEHMIADGYLARIPAT